MACSRIEFDQIPKNPKATLLSIIHPFTHTGTLRQATMQPQRPWSTVTEARLHKTGVNRPSDHHQYARQVKCHCSRTQRPTTLPLSYSRPTGTVRNHETICKKTITKASSKTKIRRNIFVNLWGKKVFYIKLIFNCTATSMSSILTISFTLPIQRRQDYLQKKDGTCHRMHLFKT